jgi:cytochrome P450
MIEASGEEGGSDEEKETTEPPTECPAAHKTTTKTSKAAVMTDAEVYANAVGFLVAGNETTSMMLSYTSYLLALNPDIQEKLQSEIDAYFEDNPVSNPHHLGNIIIIIFLAIIIVSWNLKVYTAFKH